MNLASRRPLRENMNDDNPPWFIIVSGSRYHGVRRSARGIADALSARTSVLFVEPPVSLLTRGETGEANPAIGVGDLVQENPTLWRLLPKAPPGKDRTGMRHVTRMMLARQIRSAAGQIGARRWVLLQQSAHRSVLTRTGECVAMYHASDDLASGADLLGLDRVALERAEESAARAADVILAVSPALVDRWSSIGTRIEFFPNAVDASAFVDLTDTPPAPDVSLPHPIAAVVGTLSERLDLDLLQSVADRMSLLLVGPESFRIDRSGFTSLVSRESVQWVGLKPFETLGSYYRHADVALLPYTLSAFNQASFPLKSLEYLAAGIQTVSSRLRSIEALEAPGIVFASSSAEFVAAALQQARIGASPGSSAPLRAFAGQHTWATRTDRLIEIVEEVNRAI